MKSKITENHMEQILNARSPQNVAFGFQMFPDYLCYFFVTCKSLYKFPPVLFPSDILMLFHYSRGRFSRYFFNHPSTSLFYSFFLLFNFFDLYMCTEKQRFNLCCPDVMMILLSAVNTVKFKPQTETILM